MTEPLGQPVSAHLKPTGTDAGLAGLARDWARAVRETGYIPRSGADLRAYLTERAGRLVSALRARTLDPDEPHRVGVELVAADIATPAALGQTIRVLAAELPSLAWGVPAPAGPDPAAPRPGVPAPREPLTAVASAGGSAQRLAAVLGALAAGHSQALCDRTRAEQESVCRAALDAREQAELALRASEARYRYEANHDPLTGLPNRLMFRRRLDDTFAHLDQSTDQRVGLCFLNLDGFQAINDSLGHRIGDGLLIALAHRLADRIARPGQLVARLGGDEFVILVQPSTCTDDVVKIADTALVAATEPVYVDGHELSVSACVGIVEGPVAETDPTELMRRADITLHWAKRDGRGRWALFDPVRNEHEVARYVLSAAMPGALDRDEFFLDYQPLVALDNGVVVGAEALLRWNHPELGLLPPDRFVTLAEESGLIVRLGAYVLEQACREARRWYEADPDAPFVSVNLAVRQIEDPHLVRAVADTLTATGLPASKLQLEITEGAVMGTDDESLAVLRGLADLGIRLAIDDFGTGYSNLAYLHTLPVHELKIAGSFVDGLRLPAAEDCVDARILTKLVDLAHTLGLTVTAEGVETAEQAQRLRAIGCDAGQGWHLGRPGPAAAARSAGWPAR